MSGFFVLLLEQVTIFSSVTAAILIAVRLLFKCRIPPRIGMALWTVLLARLLCPVFPESRVSVYNFIPAGRDLMYAIRADVAEEALVRTESREENPYVLVKAADGLEAAEEELPEQADAHADRSLDLGAYFAEGTDGTLDADTINRVILAVWSAGIAMALGISLAVYERAKRRALAFTEPCADARILALYRDIGARLGIPQRRLPPLRCGPAPMLVGCLQPAVIFRDDVEEREAVIVLSHELTHYRYADNPLLVFSTFVNCLFWYNPLIWAVRRMLREDIEVLCDTRTLESCGIPGTEYAIMLCRGSAFDALTAQAGCHMSLRGRQLKNRLTTISHRKHRRFLPRIASWSLCAAIIAVCLTNPIISQNTGYADVIANYAALTGADERSLTLSDTVTVSDHLAALSTLFSEIGAEDARTAIGGGSLELFRRQASGKVSDELWRELSRYKADEVLTVRSLSVLNACAAALFCEIREPDGTSPIPRVLSVSAMERITAGLGEHSASRLLAAYNRGVKGADVQLDAVYTCDMMELILSRIDDQWARDKFRGFYQEIDLTPENRESFSESLSSALGSLRGVKSVYVRDPGITRVEENTLAGILGAARAGQREDVYYLKETEDTVSRETVRTLLDKAGFTEADALLDTARIGELASVSEPGDYGLTAVRKNALSSGVTIDSTRNEAIYRAADLAWRIGVIDADEDGWIWLEEKLTAGESLLAAYRFAAALSAYGTK
ncbi:MAG: hypothetical protein IKZ41_06910 [Clostridia bacterium]|nr:hypothetical protein [Clostridia bacterium]MBR5365714.1 hypothetical protein [Clostridia bacterium]